MPEQVSPEIIPEQIIWMVYNDAADAHYDSGGLPLGVEVQLTVWAFQCEENELLNNTLFTSHKIINRSANNYENVNAGIWVDFDIGCDTDDYVGSIPSLNSFYGYNADDKDGIGDSFYCYGNLITFKENLPVQAATLLNHNLEGFVYFNNGGINSPTAGSTDPTIPFEYYNYLTGKWKDGTPLTFGGDGYNLANSTNLVKFAFPDNPNDPTGWSQFATNQQQSDQRSLGRVVFDKLEAGAVQMIDVAYSYHQEKNLNHVEVVDLLYDEIPLLHQMYQERFINSCRQAVLCEEECVWPGDANADGISNQLDLLAIGAGMEAEGPARNISPKWSPQNGEAWNQQLPSAVNFKHLDCNGDGLVNFDDFEVSKFNFGQTTPDYVEINQYPEGDELFMELKPKRLNGILLPEVLNTVKVKHKIIPDMVGLSFTLEFDRRYLKNGISIIWNDAKNCPQYLSESLRFFDDNCCIDFAAFDLEGDCMADDESLFTLRLNLNELDEPLPSKVTFVKFRNPKAFRADGTEIPIGGRDLRLIFHDFTIDSTDETTSEVLFYPNPSDGIVYFDLTEDEISNVKLFDAAGRRILIRPKLQQNNFSWI